MNTRDRVSIGVLCCALGVAAFLGLRSGKDEAAITRTTESEPPRDNGALPMMDNGALPPRDPHAAMPQGQAPLPPGHPQVGANGGDLGGDPHASGAAGAAGAGSLVWKAPATFVEQPNPSSMRLATYGVPKSGGDKEDAELSITVAGGDTAANIDRWAGQFEGGTPPRKKEKTISGRKVTLVEMSGTYSGGMGTLSGSHHGWTMYAAIVEAGNGQSYFFKMTGPTGTVRASKGAFDAMIDSVKPAS
jgi:hypothetical protein